MSSGFFALYLMFGFLFFFCFWGISFILDFYLFSFMGLDISLCFVMDFVSLGFFSCVSFISGVVFLYSGFYMEGTLDSRRFYWLVFLFVMSMFFLVFSGNFLISMVGWDGLGLVSFCLVIFYSNSISLESGLVTVFSNRIGDVFFLLSFLFFFSEGFFTWDSFSENLSPVFVFLIFLGSITKSAQIPFSAWLPAAMAAPTPVSSLVHSSTLVTAGVYVLIRFNYIFSILHFSSLKFFFLLTMLLAGGCAVLENDFKKIVAMSTLSQLGMMMFILSVGAWILSFLHMIIHAFFKSMLFLSTGSLMGQMSGTQDSRFYGSSMTGYSSFVYFSVSVVCLSGFPFFLGFYSKDFIISSCSFSEGFSFYIFFLVGCFFTIIYSVRLIHKSYSGLNKYNSTSFSFESTMFFVPVCMLFFKCWILGGFVYWLFLTSMKMSFLFLDLFVGVLIFLLGVTLYFSLRFSYNFGFSMMNILFARWGSGGGSSFSMGQMSYAKYEGSWMESLGGLGVYLLLMNLSKSMVVFYTIGLGSLIFFVCLFFVLLV